MKPRKYSLHAITHNPISPSDLAGAIDKMHVSLKTYQTRWICGNESRVWLHDAMNSWERENHLLRTFYLSACDWIWASTVQRLTMFKLWFLYLISKQHLEGGGRELSLNLPFSLHCACVFVTLKQSKANQIQISPLLKSDTSFSPPNLAKLSTVEQSALLDQICRWFSCKIPGSQSLDYAIKLYIFAYIFGFQS